MNWCWIIPIIVGLITALLGYLMGRSAKQREVDEWQEKYNKEKEDLIATQRKISLLENDVKKAQESEQKTDSAHTELKGRFDLLQHAWDENRTEIQNLKDENKELTAQLAECKEGSNQAKDKTSDVDSQSTPLISQKSTSDYIKSSSMTSSDDQLPKLVFDAAAAKEAFGRSILRDDLTIVEGIGPQIQELFHQKGVRTWNELSQCSLEECEEVLQSGGDQFNLHKPGTWPRQALLASQGKWIELKEWQDEMDRGIA